MVDISVIMPCLGKSIIQLLDLADLIMRGRNLARDSLYTTASSFLSAILAATKVTVLTHCFCI